MELCGFGPADRAVAEASLRDEQVGHVVLLAVRGPDGQVVDFLHELVNEVVEVSAGRSLQGRRLLEVFDVSQANLFEGFRSVLSSGESLRTEFTSQPDIAVPALAGRTLELYACAVGDERVVCQYRDVTELRAVQESLRQDAMQDQLTGLPNRRAFLGLLTHALTRLERGPGLVGILYCDLNGFKQVNDTQGHAAGDRLLVHVSQRMTRSLRPQDVVARYGGDEFLVLCEDLGQVGELLEIARRVRDDLSNPSESSGDAALLGPVGISIGGATSDSPITPEELLSLADAALYAAKSGGDGISLAPDPPAARRVK